MVYDRNTKNMKFFRIFFLKTHQDWNPGQWEWNEEKVKETQVVETQVGQKMSKKTSFMTSLIPKRGNWNLDFDATEKTENFRKISEEQSSMVKPCFASKVNE